MTLSTLVSNSASSNFAKTKEAIVAECQKTAKYSILNQTSYVYENGIEKVQHLTKADLSDRLVMLKVDKDTVTTFEPMIEKNEWVAMIKYSVGAKWEPIGTNMVWQSSSRFPETPSILSTSVFYEKFFFSASQNTQLTHLGRNILQYQPSIDSFKTTKLLDWDGRSVVESSIVSPGCIEYTTQAEQSTKMIIQTRNISTTPPNNGLMVFMDTLGEKYVLIGQEAYKAWNNLGVQTVGYRAAFQHITNSEFQTKRIAL
jgi:hypothetical protein